MIRHGIEAGGHREASGLLTLGVAWAAVATVFPGFLIGAMVLRIADAFAVSEAAIGSLMAMYFGAASFASAALGRLGQRLGPRNQMSVALLASAAVQLTVALWVNSFLAMAVLMALAGLLNAANQSSVNLALTQANVRSLGRAMAVKQSSMPFASLLAGVAVPAIALTVGWRMAYALGALIALVGFFLVQRLVARGANASASPGTPGPAPLTSRRRDLILAGVVGFLLAFVAGALNAWTVSSAVSGGMAEGDAGWLLGFGAAAGIGMRLYWGLHLDALSVQSRRGPFWVAGLCTLAGTVGFVLLALHPSSWIHVLGTGLAFAGAWVWPVFTNFGIVRRNRAAAAAATGISQTGVYLGLVIGPVTTGWLIASCGHSLMWWVVASVAATGAALAIFLSPRF